MKSFTVPDKVRSQIRRYIAKHGTSFQSRTQDRIAALIKQRAGKDGGGKK